MSENAEKGTSAGVTLFEEKQSFFLGSNVSVPWSLRTRHIQEAIFGFVLRLVRGSFLVPVKSGE